MQIRCTHHAYNMVERRQMLIHIVGCRNGIIIVIQMIDVAVHHGPMVVVLLMGYRLRCSLICGYLSNGIVRIAGVLLLLQHGNASAMFIAAILAGR